MEKAARRAGPLSDANSPAAVAWRVQRRRYFTLLQQKRSDSWTNHVNADQSRPRRLWRSFDEHHDHMKYRRLDIASLLR